MRSIGKSAVIAWPIKRQMLFLIMLMGYYMPCDSMSPFKWRGNGVNNGVMINTANPPIVITQNVGSSHAHGAGQFIPQPPASDIFNDIQKPFNYNPNYHLSQETQYLLTGPHYTQIHDSHLSPRRQHRNPFEIVYEWRQLDFEYPTCKWFEVIFYVFFLDDFSHFFRISPHFPTLIWMTSPQS